MAIKRKGTGNRGRQELRKLPKRGRFEQAKETVEENGSEELGSEELESEDEQLPVDDKGKAYNALLTLISAEHQETKPKKSKKQSIPQNEEEEGEIAGFNVDQDNESEEDQEADSDDEDENTDPYYVHFNNVSEDFIEKGVKSSSGKWPLKEKSSIESYRSIFQIPPTSVIPTPSTIKSLDSLPIKKRVLKKFQEYEDNDLTDLESTLMNAMTLYKDINFPYHSFKNQSYKKLYALHALNHVFKTRDSIIKNNAKLHNYQEQVKQGKKVAEVEYRDQGFTRPKVLILLPTRESCYEVVNLLVKYSAAEQHDNKKRFNSQFHTEAEPPASKPEDFRSYFKGNTNDYFTLGIKFTRKSLKLYSSFYSSDIILASPIGLSMILEKGDKKKQDFDFLSSIEVVIVDNGNQLEMQNWDHVNTVIKYLNKVPKQFHDADFSRIRMWSINDQASYLTQKLVFSEYSTPNINNIVNKSKNLSGKLKFKKVVTADTCIMNSVGLKLKQIFQRFDSESPIEDPDARYKFFTNSVINSLSNTTSYDDGVVIIIPSYFDYLRVKDYMYNHSKLTFEGIDEYTSQSKLTKIRQNFASGKVKVLLYSERLHHFRRFEIAGAKNILLYGVPSNPLFYKEYLKFIGKSVFNGVADLNLSFVKMIYSKWDAVALERIVGNERAPILCNSINETYEFK